MNVQKIDIFVLPSLVTTDHLPPSAREYSRWAMKLAEAVGSIENSQWVTGKDDSTFQDFSGPAARKNPLFALFDHYGCKYGSQSPFRIVYLGPCR